MSKIRNSFSFPDIVGMDEFVRAVVRAVNDNDDKATVISVSNALYFGPKNTDGTWRIIRVGANIELQVRTAGAWVYQGRWTP